MTGKIIKGIAGFYYVYVPGKGIYECKAKGIFRNRSEKPLVGDMVEISGLSSPEDEVMTGNIDKILPRKNSLIRPEVANVDQVMVVFAVSDPAPNLHLLDHFLVRMEDVDIPVIICFNKTDLLTDDGYIRKLKEIYEQAGYEVLAVSTVENDDKTLLSHLQGKTTVLAGPSGVGKSSLMDMIHPEADMLTGEISKTLGRGKHTTRHSEIFCIGKDSYMMDTPGFSSLTVPPMEPEQLRFYFPEYESYEGQCRFNGCIHIGEPDCAVKTAIEEGKLSKERYESYLLMYNEVKEQKRRFFR